MEEKDCEAKESKHVRILGSIRGLKESIDDLEALEAKIAGNPISKEANEAKVDVPSYSLASFLSELPQDISYQIERINKITASIKESLF